MKRQHNEKHLDFVRSLPCIVCGDNTSTEAAHVRYADPRAAKRPTGMGEKPDDAFAVPMCGRCHREQHGGKERTFWASLGIDPVFVGLALKNISGDHAAGEMIVAQNRAELLRD